VALLFKNDWYELRVEPGLLRLARTARPFDDLADLKRSDDAVAQVLLARSPREPRLLLDLRSGPPGRNDPEFERAGADSRRALATLFTRVAILVRTAAGRLQVSRLTREDRTVPGIFLDEGEALAWLTAP